MVAKLRGPQVLGPGVFCCCSRPLLEGAKVLQALPFLLYGWCCVWEALRGLGGNRVVEWNGVEEATSLSLRVRRLLLSPG